MFSKSKLGTTNNKNKFKTLLSLILRKLNTLKARTFIVMTFIIGYAYFGSRQIFVL